jgi:hypothetical protein
MIGQLTLAGLALAFSIGGLFWARLSRKRLERDDPARRGGARPSSALRIPGGPVPRGSAASPPFLTVPLAP